MVTEGSSSLREALRINPEWASLPLFDRSNWTRVRFGDVVENVNETERDPVTAGIERFIGLEHLEPGSLHVRDWGSVADGTTFTRRCRAGQVLFGKRRAYQRKVAVAEFDALVSGDIYVLAARADRLLPGLLPFICMSERFFQHAVGTSAGSLSPRTNWSSLASFEFDLPPLDQQQQLGEILREAGRASQQSLGLVESLVRLRRSQIDGLVPSPPDSAHEFVMLGGQPCLVSNTRWRRLTEIQAGPAKSVFYFDVPGSVAKSTHAGLPWLRWIRNHAQPAPHFWPFDGWDIGPGRSVVAEVYPRLFRRGTTPEGWTNDQYDAFSIADWLRNADADGRLSRALAVELPDSTRAVAQIEGWILGVAAP